MEKAFVKNAADPKQVRDGKQKEQLKRDQELNDLRLVLATPAGKRLMWRILAECKTFGSVWHSSAMIHYNSGKQDVGHWLMAEIGSADPDQLYGLLKSSYQGES